MLSSFTQRFAGHAVDVLKTGAPRYVLDTDIHLSCLMALSGSHIFKPYKRIYFRLLMLLFIASFVNLMNFSLDTRARESGDCVGAPFQKTSGLVIGNPW